ncbi:MAG: monovalent cation:proton antiporter-2 (CPA2) family protein [Rhodospirillales bacterium]|nr:monovalent cation:proton antiporter-2 (CPA2) family protein [Rhodospirillales bacterium]MDH3917621.1 monovalent cation:proton antiporter-2 (CPA2) family protein [Rhodospirillales bacterium]MDH3965835.1 monovalent cation:proton antiporter-2 (CPA2) family protein [Rhodospirillales bacterium]
MSLLGQTAIFLGAAVLAVPLSKRAGLGSVLGYLAAGAVIGPSVLGLISDVEAILHFAEFGVVLLLFVIGLELQPGRLWVMRKSIFGLGGAQVLLTAALLALGGAALGLPFVASVVASLALALSSTAFALQILAERNQLTTRHGRAAFSILLFQDLAVIPILALVPLLGAAPEGVAGGGALLSVLKVAAVLVGVVVGGHFLLRHAFRIAARTRVREVFTAMALLTVIGMALLMELAGLSMALGAFLAGVLLADSEFRHELEANIEPFKGLLLGLFFIAVGMSVDFGLLLEKPLEVGALVVALVLLKALVLFGVAKVAGHSSRAAGKLAVVLSQGGEFAFVILGLAVVSQVMERDLAKLLILVVILSMVVTPLLVMAEERFLPGRKKKTDGDDFEAPSGEENQVIIAGFGRFGQIVARILRAKRIGFTALEGSQEQVDFVRRYGNKIYYGDPSRLDLLHAAKAEQAVVFVLAIDEVEASLRTAETVRKHFPDLKIYARARNRKHAYQLMDLGVAVIQRETFLSSLDIARSVLEGLGLPDYEADRVVKKFREHDERRLYAHYGLHDDEQKMIDLAKEAAEELEELFAQDAEAEAGQV